MVKKKSLNSKICKYCNKEFLSRWKERQITCGSVSCQKENKKESSKKHIEINKERIKKTRKEYQIKNKDKLREYNREYYLENKDRINKRNTEYRLNNKDKMKEINKKYRLKNIEKIIEKQKEYSLKNKYKIKEKGRKYYLKSGKDLCECGKTKLKKSKKCWDCVEYCTDKKLSIEDCKRSLNKNKWFKNKKQRHVVSVKGKCHDVHRLVWIVNSGKHIPKGMTVDHIYPISRFPKGTDPRIIHDITNLQLLSPSENSRKKDNFRYV